MAEKKPRKMDARSQKQVQEVKSNSGRKKKSEELTPAAKDQIRIFGDKLPSSDKKTGHVRGFTPSARRVMIQPGTVDERVVAQVPDMGDEPPLNNRFGPAFDVLLGEQLTPGKESPLPIRRGSFHNAHRVAREIGIKDQTTKELERMMQTRDGVTMSRRRQRGRKVKLQGGGTPAEEQVVKVPDIDDPRFRTVYPNPANKRNNESALGPNERRRINPNPGF